MQRGFERISAVGTSLLGMALVGAALLLGGCTDETAQSQSLTAQSHNAVGAWDMTFFGVGFQFYNGSGVGVDVGNAILVQPDGKILVGGATDDGSTGTDPAIWRIMPFGNFDTAFGLGGLAVQPNGISAADQINGLTIDKTGMIVGAGQQFNTGTSSYDMAMWRFFPDGLFESQFTHSGPTGNTDDVANAVIEDAVGHYMVVGTTDNGASGNDLMIWAVRDTSMSSLDASNFNPGFGYKVFDAGGSNFDTATAVLLQPDGQLLVAGSGVVSSTTYAMSVRVDSLSGATDTLYGASGKSLVTGLGATTTIRGMVRQPSGKIVLAGDSFVSPDLVGNLIRLTANGALDTNFGTNGLVSIQNVNGTGDDVVTGIVQDAQGRLIVTGYSGLPTDVFVARFSANGTIDPAFGVAGILKGAPIPPSSSDPKAYAIAMDSLGFIYLCGKVSAAGQDVMMVWKVK